MRLGRSFPLSWPSRRSIAIAAISVPVLLAVGATPQNPPNRDPNRSYIIPAANRLPDANQQMEMREQAVKSQNFDAANTERRRQIVSDSALLLKLATELKAEVDKTSKDTLSVAVVRKAGEIERLAHGVKEKMKLTVGAN